MERLANVVARTKSAEEVAFAIAGDEYPRLRTRALRTWFDAHGAEIAARVQGLGGLARAHVLCDYVKNEVGLRGSDDYDDPRTNYLNDVIERRTGSPVLMAVILMAIGRRAQVLVQGVAFPGHFLVRIEGHYADPFEGGAPLERERLLQLARETIEKPDDAAACLEPVGARTIGVRVLLNLQRIHVRRGDHGRALVVCDRLYELTRSPIHRVDRGAHALALGARHAAIADFEAYLLVQPDGDGAKRAREELERAQKLDPTPFN